MDNSKYTEKVRKLLALAESSNPFEAERALTQAKKIMAKYNINAEDTDIVTVRSSKVPRRYLKDFETHMIGCVQAVSGCESFTQSVYLPDGKIETYITFVGLSSDANMAAYSFEVLHHQVRRFQLAMKKQGYSAPERNRASLAWSIAACEKLNSFFDYKQIPESVTSYFERQSKDFEEAQYKKSEHADEKDEKLLAHGYRKGQEARLNKATTHQKRSSLATG